MRKSRDARYSHKGIIGWKLRKQGMSTERVASTLYRVFVL